MVSYLGKITLIFSMAILLSFPKMAFASNSSVIVEKPTALAMTGDLIIARPFLLAITVIGTAVFLVSLPFSLLGGNTAEAGSTLVMGPVESTFMRCLGCTNPGYKKKIKESEIEDE
ncbi:MAG: hypothetical protein HRU20_05120 [Pseudomonadales bacterium]|nr:hypothetical protein [Pseudomonadales bacterium]